MTEQAWESSWQSIVKQLKEELPASKFDAWIQPIHPEFSEDTLTLKLPSRIFLDGLKADCEKSITALVKKVFGTTVTLLFDVDASLSLPNEQRDVKSEKRQSNIDGYIDPRFTFENFVVGSSNEFCYAACRAVAVL